jgi:hypothetical protein
VIDLCLFKGNSTDADNILTCSVVPRRPSVPFATSTSAAPSTLSTVSLSMLGIHEPRMRPSASSSPPIPKSGLGIEIGTGMAMSKGVSNATQMASPLQKLYTLPLPSIPPSSQNVTRF